MEQVFELAVKKWDDQCTAPPQHALGFFVRAGNYSGFRMNDDRTSG